MDKIVASVDEAISDIYDGAIVAIGGFGGAGTPHNLIQALPRQGAQELTLIAGAFQQFLGLPSASQVRKVITSFARRVTEVWRGCAVEQEIASGRIEVELVPQGTIAERLRAAGAGIPAFYSPVSVGTLLGEGKETRCFDDREYVLEPALKVDFALIKAYRGDRFGNLQCEKTGRNMNPLMAMAATVTIAEVEEIVPEVDPEMVAIPGIFVQRVVKAEPLTIAWRFAMPEVGTEEPRQE